MRIWKKIHENKASLVMKQKKRLNTIRKITIENYWMIFNAKLVECWWETALLVLTYWGIFSEEFFSWICCHQLLHFIKKKKNKAITAIWKLNSRPHVHTHVAFKRCKWKKICFYIILFICSFLFITGSVIQNITLELEKIGRWKNYYL